MQEQRNGCGRSGSWKDPACTAHRHFRRLHRRRWRRRRPAARRKGGRGAKQVEAGVPLVGPLIVQVGREDHGRVRGNLGVGRRCKGLRRCIERAGIGRAQEVVRPPDGRVWLGDEQLIDRLRRRGQPGDASHCRIQRVPERGILTQGIVQLDPSVEIVERGCLRHGHLEPRVGRLVLPLDIGLVEQGARQLGPEHPGAVDLIPIKGRHVIVAVDVIDDVDGELRQPAQCVVVGAPGGRQWNGNIWRRGRIGGSACRTNQDSVDVRRQPLPVLLGGQEPRYVRRRNEAFCRIDTAERRVVFRRSRVRRQLPVQVYPAQGCRDRSPIGGEFTVGRQRTVPERQRWKRHGRAHGIECRCR